MKLSMNNNVDFIEKVSPVTSGVKRQREEVEGEKTSSEGNHPSV